MSKNSFVIMKDLENIERMLSNIELDYEIEKDSEDYEEKILIQTSNDILFEFNDKEELINIKMNQKHEYL
jgi:hypothetical protein